MNFSLLEISSTFIVLFAIIDILGSVPLILNIKRRGEVILPMRTTIIALSLLLLFLFAGDLLLKLFGVDIQSFAVAGSFILFIMALEMILDVEIFKNQGPKGSSSIVPLAFPLVAGPGSFTALLSLSAQYSIINIVISLVLNLAFVYLVLRSTGKIEKIFGEGGIYIMRKFFGIILLAISVKLFTENIGHLFA